MKRARILLLAISVLMTIPILAQRPAGFSWINTESDKETIDVVRHALNLNSNTSIHKVGILDGYAIVMTTSREDNDTYQWSIYNLTLATGKFRILVSGYRIKLLDWIGTSSPELAITYYDCWGCEAATLFTTLHYTKSLGWMTRWPNKTTDANYPQPGAVVSYGDAGEPYDDNEVDQIFAVVSQPNGGFAAGRWFHSRDTKTGKVSNDVERYIIDPATGKDRVEQLSGARSLEWRRMICTPSSALLSKASIGQNSRSCKRVLNK
jgi:hypothetical protein